MKCQFARFPVIVTFSHAKKLKTEVVDNPVENAESSHTTAALHRFHRIIHRMISGILPVTDCYRVDITAFNFFRGFMTKRSEKVENCYVNTVTIGNRQTFGILPVDNSVETV